jgi:hypothetical protein
MSRFLVRAMTSQDRPDDPGAPWNAAVFGGFPIEPESAVLSMHT